MGEGGPSRKLLWWGGGGGMRKKSEIGGGHRFSNYTPPNPTSPPYHIKNERSLISKIWVGNYDKYKSTAVRPFLCLDGLYELQKWAK